MVKKRWPALTNGQIAPLAHRRILGFTWVLFFFLVQTKVSWRTLFIMRYSRRVTMEIHALADGAQCYAMRVTVLSVILQLTPPPLLLCNDHLCTRAPGQTALCYAQTPSSDHPAVTRYARGTGKVPTPCCPCPNLPLWWHLCPFGAEAVGALYLRSEGCSLHIPELQCEQM